MSWGIKTVTYHPFGQGNLTASGVQYSSVVTNASTSYTAVETATIDLESADKLLEVEYALTLSLYTSTAKTSRYKWQASDDNTNWADLCTAQAATASTSYQNSLTVSGYCDLDASTNFTGNLRKRKAPFYIRAVSANDATASTLSTRTKNSSYLTITYMGY